MKAIMTVTGLDHTGIIAAVAIALAELDVNIINVSQTLMSDYFTMILEITFDENRTTIAQIKEHMVKVEESERMVIHVQSEAIFKAMHEV